MASPRMQPNGQPESGPPRKARGKTTRGRHDGSVVYDEKRRLWRGAIMLDGKRYWVSGKTEAAAKRKLAAKRKDFYDWTLTEPGRLTVAQVVADWLEQVVKRRRRLSTYTQYESLLRVNFLPHFGTKLVRDLLPRQLERFYADLEDGTIKPAYRRDAKGRPLTGRARRSPGLSGKSIRDLHAGLHAALARAVRHRLIPRNPADGVELPAIARRNGMQIEVDDLLRLLRCSRAEYDAGKRDGYPLWVFLAHTGLRIGEALALRWAN
ncbi:MAG: tyrosine-type recombinase/integrase, partial [Chloroflexota bacterium]